MPYTFAQLKSDCNAILWPNGTPENLTDAINALYVEAIIEVQKFVPCMRERQESVYPQCSTYFRCGTTWFDAPKGRISKVYVTQGSDCQPVTYTQTNSGEVQCWSRRFNEIVSDPVNSGLEPLRLGFKYPEQSTDSSFGRALTGLWAFDTRGAGARITLAPWIQSDESIVVEWSGVKLSWSDLDSFAEKDPDLNKAVRMYVRWAYESLYVCDRVQTAACRADYDFALADLIHECNEQTRQRKADPQCCNELASLFATATAPSVADLTDNEDTTTLGAFGDYGMDNSDELAVSELVKGWDPDGILTLGDNNYPTGAAATLDTNVGKYYGDYIFPYLGTFDSDATENRFWPTLGHADLNTSAGAPYLAYFPIPVNERFYETVIGHVHVFALNSGFDTSNTLQEPAGNSSTSIQAEWLRAKLLQSTAKWKIVILHHPPWSNNVFATTGTAELRWPYETWGATAVIAGHAHMYERIQKPAYPYFPYFTVGTGGAELTSQIETPVDARNVYDEMHGAMKIEARCDRIRFQFWNTAGELIDQFTIPDDGENMDENTGGEAVPATPDAPVLTGSVDGFHDVTLDWNNVDDETGYEVWRSVGGVTYVLVATLGPDVITFGENFDEIDGLFYKVRAFNDTGYSAFSNVLDLSPPVVPPTTYTAYFGRSASPILDEAGILALTPRVQMSVGGNYSFAAGSGYYFLSFPITEPAPTSIKFGVFNVPLAEVTEGYTDTVNGLTCLNIASVNFVPHRLFRGYFEDPGAVVMTVT